MNLVALIYLFGAIISLKHSYVRGQVNSHSTNHWRGWQWYLKSTVVSMNVNTAWQAGYTGKGILVAVVDDGVKISHPNLISNVNLTASYDFLNNRRISTYHSPGSHGTKCAGIIAGGDNRNCGVGVAFDAQISSIRIYSSRIRSTDQSEANGLSFKRDMIDIYSNSWGPGDMGWQVKGPGTQLKDVLEKGIRLGRRGKGSIFVFSAGNGGISGDSCAFNGYVNSIETIAISTVNWDGSVPGYAERCAAIMAVTYGQDMFPFGNIIPPIVTTKESSGCTEIFPGTSSSAAMASGIIALALQANPDLTWRDVQHIIVRSSKPITQSPITRNRWRVTRDKPSWNKNTAGLLVSREFGFGLMDASKMIEYAKKWSSVPQQLSCEVMLNASNFNSSRLVIPSRGDLHLTLSLNQDDCSIRHLEHMQAEVNLRFPRRGYVEMSSTSPSGTQSKLLYSRKIDSLTGFKNFTNWRVTSLHYWGERPIGDWNISIRNARPRSNVGIGRVFGLKLILYGTKEDPLENNKHVDRRAKKIATSNISRREKDIPIHGGYSQWSHWYGCSRSCAGGIQQRHRWCNNPRPKNGGRDCKGLGRAAEERRCNTHMCPVHGGYSTWGTWSQCSASCGGGQQQRTRTCTNPRPAYGGRNCVGRSVQTQRCGLISCPPVDGGYSQWTSWSQCSATCDNGTQQRSRSCTAPPPANGGKPCAGPSHETQICMTSNTCPSPVDGGYSQWTSWSQCSATCDNGTQQRSRSCTAPPPANGGKPCAGPSHETQICMTSNTCPSPGTPIHGGYSHWSSWSSCSRTCAGGTQDRSRSCTNPQPANGGRDCSGLGQATESRSCNTQSCPVAACADIATLGNLCKQWSNNGKCSDPSVKRWCKKTCGGCPACKNTAPDNYCQQRPCSNPFVFRWCLKTCGSC